MQESILRKSLAALQPYNTFSVHKQDRALVGDELAVYKCFASAFTNDPHSCYGNRLDPTGYGDLYLWISDHLDQFVTGQKDHDVAAAFYDVPESIKPDGLLGLADDNWSDGTQSYVYTFRNPTDGSAPNPVDLAVPGNLTFTPAGPGQLRAAAAPASFDPAPGSDLHLGDDTTSEVALPFTFPFLGTSYSSVFVNSNGNITFGAGDLAAGGGLLAMQTGPPRIAPFFRDLDPSKSGSVSASVRSDRLVVTWSGVPAYGIPSSNTFQVTLARTGQITYSYQQVGWPLAVVGVAAGGGQGAVQPVDLSRQLPATYRPGTVAEAFTAGVQTGPTWLLTHEVGHHLGLSHPHDGYDSETQTDFSGYGETYFAWEGDYSDSVMSYATDQGDYSQFDRDAIDRDMTTVFINQANRILADIQSSDRADKGRDKVQKADRAAGAALAAMAAMDYRAAAADAAAAYRLVVEAAKQAGVPVTAGSSSTSGAAATRSKPEPIVAPGKDPRGPDY